jgi:hypothetical protein
LQIPGWACGPREAMDLGLSTLWLAQAFVSEPRVGP